MTPTGKQLAEFGAEFLKLEKLQNGKEWKFQFQGINWLVNEDSFFDDSFGPVLMHLAEMELIKMETKGLYKPNRCGYRITQTMEQGLCRCQIEVLEPLREFEDPLQWNTRSKNKFRAFWTAVYMAVKGGSDGP